LSWKKDALERGPPQKKSASQKAENTTTGRLVKKRLKEGGVGMHMGHKTKARGGGDKKGDNTERNGR